MSLIPNYRYNEDYFSSKYWCITNGGNKYEKSYSYTILYIYIIF